MDDDELDELMLKKDEVKLKTEVWEDANQDWERAQELKRKAAEELEAQVAANGGQPQKK